MSKENQNEKKVTPELFKTSIATTSINEFVKKIENDVDKENNNSLIESRKDEQRQIIFDYILGVSKKAEELIATLKSLGDKINKPDINKVVRTKETNSFENASEYTVERSKLLIEAVTVYGCFITLYDKAYLHGSKENWKSVEEKFKSASGLIKKINTHLGK